MRFFFQAEDGMRDIGVTGVQTCALPICRGRVLRHADLRPAPAQAPARRGHLLRGGREGRHLADRKSVVSGKSVDLGGPRIIKKNSGAGSMALLKTACSSAVREPLSDCLA